MTLRRENRRLEEKCSRSAGEQPNWSIMYSNPWRRGLCTNDLKPGPIDTVLG
jgi:hypothetical protein